MANRKHKAKPAEGSVQHAHDMNHATPEEKIEQLKKENEEFREIAEEIEQLPVDEYIENDDEPAPTHTRYYRDSPIGPIRVIASVRVDTLEFIDGDVVVFLDTELSVTPNVFDPYQHLRWSVKFEGRSHDLMNGLEAYLEKYCPAPKQVLETLTGASY
jgi:hypothetical protein